MKLEIEGSRFFGFDDETIVTPEVKHQIFTQLNDMARQGNLKLLDTNGVAYKISKATVTTKTNYEDAIEDYTITLVVENFELEDLFDE